MFFAAFHACVSCLPGVFSADGRGGPGGRRVCVHLARCVQAFYCSLIPPCVSTASAMGLCSQNLRCSFTKSHHRRCNGMRHFFVSSQFAFLYVDGFVFLGGIALFLSMYGGIPHALTLPYVMPSRVYCSRRV